MMARILSLFLLIIFAGQSLGLVVPESGGSYRYDGSGITKNTQIYDYDVFQKVLDAEIRQPLESLSEISLGGYFFAFVDGFVVSKSGSWKVTEVVQVSGRIESNKLRELDKK